MRPPSSKTGFKTLQATTLRPTFPPTVFRTDPYFQPTDNVFSQRLQTTDYANRQVNMCFLLVAEGRNTGIKPRPNREIGRTTREIIGSTKSQRNI